MPNDIKDLLVIMQQLRDPETGCPWDIQQNFKTIAPYTIEEAYEVADAIERNDLNDLKDELGDLLLQVVFHSQMAQEQGVFSFNDVVESICDKMTRRHPHVFAGANIEDAEAQTKNWEELKAQERLLKANAQTDSILTTVPNNLPGLTRARKLTKKAATVGFDWPDIASVLDKVDEEVSELKEAVANDDTNHAAEELGDLLFVLCNVARHLNTDPDASLRQANQKFMRRFQYIEESLRKAGRSLESASLQEMDELWDEAKLCLHKA